MLAMNTNAGRVISAELRGQPLFAQLARRSDLTVAAVGGMSATRLKDFVYQAIPEIIDMKWGDEIAL
jgi:hypothetical protein